MDGSLLAGATRRIVAIWSTRDWELVHEWSLDEDIRSVSFCEDGRRVLSMTATSLRSRDVRTGEESVTEWALPEDADDVILSAGRVAWTLSESGGAFGSVEVQDLELKHTLYSEREGFGSTATALAFAPTNDSMVIARWQSGGSTVDRHNRARSNRSQVRITERP